MKIELEFVLEMQNIFPTIQCQNLEQEIKNVQWQPEILKMDTSVTENLK